MVLPSSEVEFAASLERGEQVLTDNGYPGRWLAMGRGVDYHEGELFLAYSFGGRSETSRGRTAIQEGSDMRLVAPGMTAEEMADVPDAALIYYHPIAGKDGVFVVSNGGQTKPVLEAVVKGASFEEAVSSAPTVLGTMRGAPAGIDLSSYEPDDPINTPRITGVIDTRLDAVTGFGLAVVRKDLQTEEPIRTFYTADLMDIKPGIGWAIQTYGINDPRDRDTPPPSFDQDPYGFTMHGDTTEIAEEVRNAIGEETFAAAIVRSISVATQQFNGSTIINTRG